jgi:hypothetical protein
MMGSLRMEDDVFNSLGAGLVTGSLISSNFMTSGSVFLCFFI